MINDQTLITYTYNYSLTHQLCVCGV